MIHEKIVILDFGGQYSQLIARRVRELDVFCEIVPYTIPLYELIKENVKGIIFTGGPKSVNDPTSPCYSPEILDQGIPVLGICYGAQLVAKMSKGAVSSSSKREYGKTTVHLTKSNPLFEGIPSDTTCWMSHTDHISTLPTGYEVTACSEGCPVAAMAHTEKHLYALQFHPEVMHTAYGTKMLKNFLFTICKCRGDWKMSLFVEDAIVNLRTKIGKGKVLCALSGGVDSSVAAVMVHKAVGKQLTCIFVDHGFLRKDEGDQVERVFSEQFDMNLIRINAQDRFLKKLKGVSDSERKRKIIGEEFIRVFEEEAKKIGKVDYLIQGTIYPDVIESGIGDAAVIKSHHNVGGLPEHVSFKEIIEPLRLLFKDEVRNAGLTLGIPPSLIWRQPFPGPGLAIRIMGEITPEKLSLLQEADAIFREEIAKAGLDREYSQYFAVLTGVRSVGVMGDERTYDYTLALRCVTTTDFMTADFARIPYDLLSDISVRIINEVGNINRVVYDITTKPPATIEWE
jgi:GMP synthase (glutamine-hydrolysing)